MSARDDVLARVRAALDGSTAQGRPTTGGDRPASGTTTVPRDYRARGDLAPGSAEAVDVLIDRLVDYRAHVHRAGTPTEVGTIVGDLLADAASVVVPPGLDGAWLAALGAGTAVVHDARDDPRTPDELDHVDAVVTGARVAIADTGTIVLDGGERSGRRALTLVPDYHLCVVEAGQVVASVPDAVAALAQAGREGRPITFVSGPSATSDIELERVEGVHGPRTLHVVVVG